MKKILIIIKDIKKELLLNKNNFLLITLLFSIILGMSLSIIAYKNNSNFVLKKNKNNYNIMDIELYSKTGFNKSIKDKLKEIKNIKGVSLGKKIYGKIDLIDNKSKDIEILSIKKNINSSQDNDNINKIILTNGKIPKIINEGLIDENFAEKNNIYIGDLITIDLNGEDLLRAKKIKIVGTVKNKNKRNLIYLNESNFYGNEYNNIYITLNNTNTIEKTKNEIYNLVNPILNEQIGKSINEINNNIIEIDNNLNKLYALDLPQESLNDSILNYTNKKNELNKELENIKNDELNIKITNVNIDSKTSYKNYIYILVILILIILILKNINKIIKNNIKEINFLKLLNINDFIIYLKYIVILFISILISNILGSTIFYFIFSSILFKFSLNTFIFNIYLNLSFIISLILFLIFIILIFASSKVSFKEIYDFLKEKFNLAYNKFKKT